MKYKTNHTYFLKENTLGELSKNKVKIVYENNKLNFNFDIINNNPYNPYKNDNENLYEYDVVEVFISLENSYDRYFEYELSPFGVRFLGIIDNPTLKEAKLTLIKPNFSYEVNLNDKGYTATISVDVNKDNINNILFNCFAIETKDGVQHLYALNPTLSNTFHLSSFLSKLDI